MYIIFGCRSSVFGLKAAALASLLLHPAPCFQEHSSVGHCGADRELPAWDYLCWVLVWGKDGELWINGIKHMLDESEETRSLC